MPTKKEEHKRFVDIRWLMPSVDIRGVLDRLGVRVQGQIGDEIWGWCPDHSLFVHREPSHPKWSVNVTTGQTKCLTEDRGSNLVFIISRLRKCSEREAAEWMVGGSDLTEASIRGMENDLQRLAALPKTEKKTVKGLTDIAELLKTGSMGDAGYDFFMRPPGKKPTLIEKTTVEHFGCVECRNGFYANRVVIPCKMRGVLVGFVALDILGKKEWAKQHPTLDPEEKYKKVLFPSGMERGKMLFGFDEVKKGEVIAIVEGAREVMKLYQLGHRALAVQGAGISAEQVKLLAEIAPKRIVILMDGDDAGYEAQRKMHKTLSEFFGVTKGNTPRGHDPKTLAPERISIIFEKNVV